MSLRRLPEIKAFKPPHGYQWEANADVMTRWAAAPVAASEDDATISIYDVIGEDFWTGGGFTAKRMSAALRAIGPKPVFVNINSPGGDMFEGIAIYNLLREHPAKVTVKIVGWAASAASVIAMAGDEIMMCLGTFMMVHNAWGVVIGNRHDMRAAADLFDGFDAALADIYEARTGLGRADIEKLMDAETFMGPGEAVDKGFADSVSEGSTDGAKALKSTDKRLMARRQTEAALARAGMSRSQRSDLLSELMADAVTGRDAGHTDAAARDAGRPAARDAGFDPDLVRKLINSMT